MRTSTFDEYQQQTEETAIYPGVGTKAGLIYATLGLNGEAGEFAERVKKMLRDGGGRVLSNEEHDAMVKELGDTLWYLARAATELGVSLETVAQRNLEKLADRKNRGSLQGSGDDR